MRKQQIPNFNGLAFGQRATAQVPNYSMSLGKIGLRIGGTLTKATIPEVVLKIGSRTVFGPINATDLDRIMAYRGQTSNAAFVSLDFTEKDAKNRAMQEVGAIDIPSLGGDGIFLEVLNSLGSGSPTIQGTVHYAGRQFVDANNDGRNDRKGKLMHKLLRYSLPNTGLRYVWQPVFNGAQIKRVHFVYTGTDFTGSANGNLFAVEVKMNGRSAHDNIQCLDNRFSQTENGKVPQTRMYTVDFIEDDIIEGSLDTRGARSLEFNLNLTATDNVTAYVECLDVPGNL